MLSHLITFVIAFSAGWFLCALSVRKAINTKLKEYEEKYDIQFIPKKEVKDEVSK